LGIIDDMKETIKAEVAEEMKEKSNDRGILDIVTEKAISRKLLVWVVSTVMLAFNKLTPDEWTAISLGYVGIEGIADIAIKWRGAKNDQSMGNN
jgi:hypothetical protein